MTNNETLTNLTTERELIIEEQTRLVKDKMSNEERTINWLIENRYRECLTINWNRVKTLANRLEGPSHITPNHITTIN